MKQDNKRSSADKIIHIRINEETHRKLKVEAASSMTSIQQIVENLIEKKFNKRKSS